MASKFTDIPTGDEKITDTQELIIELLRQGKRTNAELREYVHIGAAHIRKNIHELRLKGFPICSDQDGYWFGEADDLARTIAHIKHRTNAMQDAVKALEWCIKNTNEVFTNQMKIGD